MKTFTKTCISSISFLAATLILAACSNIPGLVGTDSAPEYFPNRIGTSWTFAPPNTTDEPPSYTKTVSIIGQTTILNGMTVSLLRSIYEYESDSLVDTQYVFTNKDSVVIFSKSNYDSFTREHKFLLPLRVGDKVRWTRKVRALSQDSGFIIDGAPDIGEVLSQGSMRIGSKQYDNVFMVQNVDGTDWRRFVETTFWIVPELGIVKRVESSCSISPYTGREGGGVKSCYPYDRWELRDFETK